VVVPVIEADSRPVRVKPENAGGLQVAGAEDQVMGGLGSKVQGMAPPVEVPAAQALQAQMPPQAAVPQPAAPQPALAAGPPVAAAPQPAAPSPSTARQAPAAAGLLVQLAAVDSEDAAQSEWQRLAKRMPDLLGDRRPVVQRADRDGRAVWRVRTGGFADIADATAFCARLRAKGAACSIVGS
jgi:cell division septation protein DedD